MAGTIRALIFDFDGVILDTEMPAYEAWRENYAAHGHDLPIEVYVECVGSDYARFDPRLHLESLTGEKIDWDRWDVERESRALEKINALTEPMPGIRELIEAAASAGIPCAVASSSPRSWVEPHLERIGLRRFFRLIRCLDDVSEPKPSPELFLSAAAGLGVQPSEAVVFEDSLHGLTAARAAGMRCVVAPSRLTGHLDFTGAAMVVESLAGMELAAIAAGDQERL